jgi:D-alanine-D-alanine ligase
MVEKQKVGVIFGGRSGEHEVSLVSARSVMAALDRDKYEVIPIGITREGAWVVGEQLAQLSASVGTAALPSGDDLARGGFLAGAQDATLMQIDRQSRITPLTELDVVFPVLHGTYGEDGTVQGLLELANVPYIGANVVGAAVGMDKAIFKNVMEAHGLPVLPWRLVTRMQWQREPEVVLDELEAALAYPMFTKPANLGSSVGIKKCTDYEALIAGINEAARYDRRVVVEQGARVRELEVAVLGNEEPQASVVGEIRPKRDFYDYEAKYITDDSELFIPADIPAALSDAVRQLAVRAYQAIDCAGLGRVDFLYDTETERLYINEINTIPGFTSISMYPKLWEATGLSYSALLDQLIELAIARYSEKMANQT